MPDSRLQVGLHLAYSSMLQLSPTEVLIVWERGPLGGNCKGYPAPHCFVPSGEYQTLRARTVTLSAPLTKAASTAGSAV